jgi:uncharacterized protein (DUF58 family)
MLSEAFLRSLRNLRLNPLRRRTGSLTGERRSVRRGRSVEFADYRNYTPGDDPRRVDWNIYARLERPYIKLFEDEEDLTTHILLDSSPSMQWQDEDEDGSHKWRRAAELAVALGYIALVSGDKLVLEANGSGGAGHFGPRRGGAAMAELIKFVEGLLNSARGSPSAAAPAMNTPALALNDWFKRYALKAKPGLCVIISDLLDEAGFEEGLTALGSSRLDLHLLHTLCPAELDPELIGDLKLKDVETHRTQDLSLDEAVMTQYRQRLDEWTAGIASFARRRGGRYHLTDTALPMEQILLKDLRREEWLV